MLGLESGLAMLAGDVVRARREALGRDIHASPKSTAEREAYVRKYS